MTRSRFVVLAVCAAALLSACGGQMPPPQQQQQPTFPPPQQQPPQPQPQPPQATTGEVSIVNSSSISVWYIYLSPASASQWGPDQLHDRVLASGGTFVITEVPPGTYDLKAVSAAGDTWHVWGFRVERGFRTNVSLR